MGVRGTMELNHTEAAKTHAVERYLLGEMNQDERMTFEDHYFNCRICSVDVSDGMQMISAGRVVVREDVPQKTNVVPLPSRWKRWFPAAAAAALIASLLGNGLQFTRTAELREELAREQAPAVVQLHTLELAQKRGAAEPTTVPADHILDFDIQIDESPDAVSYVAEVHDSSGKVRNRLGISRDTAKEPVTLRTGNLPAGRYELVIRGVRKDGKSFEVASGRFVVGGR